MHIFINFELKSRETLFKKMRKHSGYFMLCSRTVLLGVVILLTAKSDKSGFAAKIDVLRI